MEAKRGSSKKQPKSSSNNSSSGSSSSGGSSSGSSDSSGGPGSPASPEAAPAATAAATATAGGNAFANDGSFMELFKKKMEEEERRKKQLEEDGKAEKDSADAGQSSQAKKTFNVASFVGKRRGGAKLALKTGMVAKKQKLDSEAEAGKGDAWSKYMAEVKKYKAHQCGDDDKTRPLVK
ncbi:telomerase RNA component interacting RNase [Salminus brasiliensis]|uniref:telomerase RNA component interacting RNase n=1 Tax=Salminus brasiliensis TaxID=930266 RepID=UPI003B82D8C1